MKMGIPKEIKNGEFRVALTPNRVTELVNSGHQIYVEKSAGLGSGFSDSMYEAAGAVVLERAIDIWNVDLVVKVKEPLPQEYQFLRPQLGLFTYLHLAGEPELANVLLKENVRAIAYETVALPDRSLPLLAPMSQIAGRVAMLFAAHFLQKNCMGEFAGRGKLLGGISGIEQGRVIIIGGGNVGRHAAQVALGLGAEVVIFDQYESCLMSLDKAFHGALRTKLYRPEQLKKLLPTCDVLIGAVLVAGEHAPALMSREMIASMQPGSLFVDVAIDQGGMSETSRVTSYDQPTYIEEGVIHCCLPNLPASVAQSSTEALGFATFPYIKALADKGLDIAIEECSALMSGVNTWDGILKHEGVAKALLRN